MAVYIVNPDSMTNEITTIVKKYYACLKDGRNIPLDELDKKIIEDLKASNKYSAFIQIWSWKDKFNGEVSMVQEITEVKSASSSGIVWVCDYASRHTLHETCNCFPKYRILGIEFTTKMAELYPKKYTSTLSPQEKANILASI